MFHSENWRLSAYPVREGLPTIAGFDPVIALWDRKRGDRLLPARRDFELWDLGRWAGWVNFSVMTPDGPVFSLYGSANAQLFNNELTGRNLCDFVEPAYRTELLELFRTVAAGPAIGLVSGQSVMQHVTWLHVQTLVLPLGDDHGTVDRFMHVIEAAAVSNSG